MNPGSRILIAGYYGFGNTGDEAILAAMLAALRAGRPDLGFTVVSGSPEETSQTHGVASVLWTDVAGIIEAIAHCDLVVVGGGGLFQDYWAVEPSTYFTSRHHSLSFYGGLPLLARGAGRPCVLYAVGLGPLRTAKGQRFTEFAAAQCSAVLVRDRESADLLPGHKVELVADPAFALPVTQADDAAAQSLLVERGLNPQEPFLALCPRHWEGTTSGMAWVDSLSRALDIFQARCPVPVVILPMQANPACSLEDDAAVGGALRERMTGPERVHVLPRPLAPAVAAALLGRARSILTVRLHGAILGLAAARPVVALAYDPKVSQLMHRAGLNAQCFPLDAFDPLLLAEKLYETWQNADALTNRLRGFAQDMRQLALKAARLTLDLLNRPGKTEPEPALELLPIQVMRALAAEATISRQESELAQTRERLAQTQDRLAAVEEGLLRERAARQNLLNYIDGIHHSPGWRMLQGLRRMVDDRSKQRLP